jgi:hypothetical protein
MANSVDFRVKNGLLVASTATIQSTVNATSTATGALQVVGGVGIGRNLYVGGTIYGTFIGTGTITTATNLAGGSAGQIPYQTAAGQTSFISTGTAGNVLVSNGTGAPTYNNTLTLTGTTTSISTTTGALQVAGGVGIGGNLYVGGEIVAQKLTIELTTVTTTLVTTDDVIKTTNNTNATSTATGALQITGGAGIGGNLYVGNTATITSNVNATSTTTGALQVVGGAGIGRDLYVGGNIYGTFAGTVAGVVSTATQVYTIAQTANATYYPAFVDSNNASATGESVYTTSSFSINPSNSSVVIGTLGFGSTTAQAGELNVISNLSALTPSVYISQTGNFSGSPPELDFIKMRNNSGILLTTETLGSILFKGADGAALQTNASIVSANDGAVNSGSLTFNVNNAGTFGAAVTIKSTGNVGIGTATPAYRLDISGGARITGITTVTDTTQASSTVTGALQVAGGAGIGRDLYVGGNIYGTFVGTVAGMVSTASQVNTVLQTSANTYYPALVDSNNATAIGESVYTTSSFSITPSTGVVRIGGSASSTSTQTGALLVTGGAGIGGDVNIGGALNAISKSFVIPHPSIPGKTLRHGSLEGPEFGVYVRGRLQGSVIELPDYWINLVDQSSITVQLTPIGSYQKLFVQTIDNNRITIGNGNLLNKTIDCYYTVWAERKDLGKLKVES